MKLNDVRPNVETSGDLEEQLFGIEDQGMIFDILRNKMYSNPILAICREITCNARDAHREVGRPEIPIQIHLPNNLEPYYKVTDFGPGISPDRMINIFIKYTASTKRNDNTQTGGFGLGAKTPFSYSDSFTVTTNYNGKRYNYNAFIDPSKIGKMAFDSESETTEPNGTTIMIPVEPKNFNEFLMYTEQACRHWDVKPIIKGGEIRWTEYKPILEGTNWCICGTNDWGRNALLLIDGIEYPCPMETLRKYADAKLIDSSRGNLIMTFGVGELTLSASRESVYWDEKTQKVISDRMAAIMAEVKKRVTDKIDTFPDLWTANVFYRDELRQGFHDIRFLGNLKWKGMDLTDRYVDTGCKTFHFRKGGWSRGKGNDPNRLRRSTSSQLVFEQNSALFVNDLPLREPTPRHVRKAFDDDPKLATLQVVCPNDKMTIADLNTKFHLDKMVPRLLSSVTKASARKYTPASQRVLVFKFDSQACGFKQSSYGNMEDDPQDKVLCLLNKETMAGNRNIVLKNKNDFPLQALRWLVQKNPTISFYGIDQSTSADRIEEDFSDLEELDNYLNDQVNDKTINFVEVKYASDKHDLDHTMLKLSKKMDKLITDKNSLFMKRIRLHTRLSELQKGDSHLLTIYESVNGEITKADQSKWVKDNPDCDYHKFEKEYSDTYPLIEYLNTYYNPDDVAPALAHYINIIDRGENNNV